MFRVTLFAESADPAERARGWARWRVAGQCKKCGSHFVAAAWGTKDTVADKLVHPCERAAKDRAKP